jgi:hypothetical protein
MNNVSTLYCLAKSMDGHEWKERIQGREGGYQSINIEKLWRKKEKCILSALGKNNK